MTNDEILHRDPASLRMSPGGPYYDYSAEVDRNLARLEGLARNERRRETADLRSRLDGAEELPDIVSSDIGERLILCDALLERLRSANVRLAELWDTWNLYGDAEEEAVARVSAARGTVEIPTPSPKSDTSSERIALIERLLDEPGSASRIRKELERLENPAPSPGASDLRAAVERLRDVWSEVDTSLYEARGAVAGAQWRLQAVLVHVQAAASELEIDCSLPDGDAVRASLGFGDQRRTVELR